MGRTKELLAGLDEARLKGLESVEAENFYLFWEANYNPITMLKPEEEKKEKIDTQKVNRYIDERNNNIPKPTDKGTTKG